jgi:hypothetical protein
LQLQKEVAARSGGLSDGAAKDAIARQLRNSAEGAGSSGEAAPAAKGKKGAAAKAAPAKGGAFSPTAVLADGTLLFSAEDLLAAKA